MINRNDVVDNLSSFSLFQLIDRVNTVYTLRFLVQYVHLSTAVHSHLSWPSACALKEVLLWSLCIVYLAKKAKKSQRPRRKWSRKWLLKKREYSRINLLRELQNEPNNWRNYLRMDEDLTYVEFIRLS